MIVILNNGTRIRIDMEATQAIVQNLMTKEVSQWQVQLDVGGASVAHLFNLKDVSAICKEEDVIDSHSSGADDPASILNILDHAILESKQAKEMQPMGTPAFAMYLACENKLRICRDEYLQSLNNP